MLPTQHSEHDQLLPLIVPQDSGRTWLWLSTWCGVRRCRLTARCLSQQWVCVRGPFLPTLVTMGPRACGVPDTHPHPSPDLQEEPVWSEPVWRPGVRSRGHQSCLCPWGLLTSGTHPSFSWDFMPSRVSLPGSLCFCVCFFPTDTLKPRQMGPAVALAVTSGPRRLSESRLDGPGEAHGGQAAQATPQQGQGGSCSLGNTVRCLE